MIGQVQDAAQGMGNGPLRIDPRRGGQVDGPSQTLDRVKIETGEVWVQQRGVLRLRGDLGELAERPFKPRPQFCAPHQQCRHSIGMGVQVKDMAQGQGACGDVDKVIRPAAPAGMKRRCGGEDGQVGIGAAR